MFREPKSLLGSYAAGVPVSSRVSAKIQQLVNTLKRPKRPPLREFFVDDFEELLEGREDLTVCLLMTDFSSPQTL